MKVLDAIYQNKVNQNNDIKEIRPENHEKLDIDLLQWISELKLRKALKNQKFYKILSIVN